MTPRGAPVIPGDEKPIGAAARILLLPLMAYAASGLVLSLTVHLLSFFDLQPGGTALFGALHVGIFPLWFAVVFISMRLTSGVRRKDYWKAALSGCPTWMRYMTYGFFIYALLNFILLMAVAPTGKHIGGAPPSSVWHGFSGHWMAFYAAGLAILTTAYRRGLSNLEQKCPNGHVIGFGDKFCPTCGVSIDGSRTWWRRPR
jgi:hypothetical protein